MKYSICILLFLIMNLFVSILSFGQTTDSIDVILGEYTAYKWFALPVTEMLTPEANSYCGKKMVININSIIVFADTIKDVNYQFKEQKQIEFFRVYRKYDYRKMKIKNKDLTVMSVICTNNPPSPQFDIVITKEYLFTEYKGFIYLFRKSQSGI